ncbi:hypothetical protein ACFWFZ_26485 [Streptomyces sp. NPDC060232]|uniref:hypothetical protein n=1 Tax=Streptomyces sp. NPDC060232 TaxID=3347079 RepID=UPI0036489335
MGIVRSLLAGDRVDHHGTHFDIEDARLWDLPGVPPPIGIAASDPASCARRPPRRRPGRGRAGTRSTTWGNGTTPRSSRSTGRWGCGPGARCPIRSRVVRHLAARTVPVVRARRPAVPCLGGPWRAGRPHPPGRGQPLACWWRAAARRWESSTETSAVLSARA